MKRVLKKVTAALLAATMVVGLAACGTVEAQMTRAARAANQERLKSEFPFGLQQTYLDHSVKRCWMQQLRHWM